jgi:hypothetical protein
MTTPPLTMIICPVTNRDSSDTRNSAAPTRSSGRLRDLAVPILVGLLAKGGLDEARGQDVDPDGRCQLPGQRLAEARDAALGRTIEDGILAGHTEADVIPRHVDDRAAPRAHDLCCGPRGEHRPAQVHREDAVQLLETRERGAWAGEDVGAGVVDPAVHSAEALRDGARQRRHVVLPADVGADHLDLAPQRADLLRRLLGSIGIGAIGDREIRPFPATGQRDRASDAARCARDQHHLPVQPHAASLGSLAGANFKSPNISEP